MREYMEPLVFGCIAAVSLSVGLAIYRKRLEIKVRKVKKEVERLEAEKRLFLAR